MGTGMRVSSTEEYLANTPPAWEESLSRHLTGERVRLWPYAPLVGYPPTQLYAIWELFEREDLWKRVLYQRTAGNDLRSLEYFMPWWDGRNLVLVEDLEGGGLTDLGGVMWFDDLVPGLRANMSIVYARRLWGRPAREASHLGMHYAFETLGLTYLWGFTPWRIAARHAIDCGWRLHTMLPHWIMLGGKSRDIYMVTVDLAAWVRKEGAHGIVRTAVSA